ncbi:MAG: PAS domain S-box protein [Alphaproteobacteria bacterium]|uniref:histidine kinase n=1 Tax=Candidatus Nitrobium versatile TaxID=2884831 RepID=A0A953J3Q1_9BACT|nr:PAS domain S-box protein [Candidatus Nitrobium versatile]
MTVEKKILLFSLAAGVCAAVLDATVDSLFFHKGPFLENLLFEAPPFELFFRGVILAVFAASGFIVSRSFVRIRRVEEELRRNRDTFEETVAWRTAFLREANGRLEGELRDRVRIEEELRNAVTRVEEEKAKTEAIIATIGDGLSILDTDYRILYQNKKVIQFIGELTGELCYKAIHGNDTVCEGCPVALSFRDGEIHTCERTIETGRGSLYFENTASPLRDASGRIIAGIELVRDITARKHAEKALEFEREKLRLLYDNSPDGVVVMDTKRRILYANRKTEELVGVSSELLKGRQCFEAILGRSTDCPGCKVEEVIRAGSPRSRIKHEVTASGRENWLQQLWYPVFDSEGVIDSVVEIARDITEMKRLEAELLKAKKIESIGILAGGIAHDFNNLLTGIMGCLSIARDMAKPGDEIHEVLTMAQKASRQAKDLTYQLLTFSRGGEPVKKATLLYELLKEAALFALSGSAVKCEFLLPGDLWPVEIDEGQIRQVIHNIALNAREAMQEGGTVVLRAENCILEGNETLPLQRGRYVKVSLQDRGVGIPGENLPRIFDPYFTTKSLGNRKGTGLGLAICYTIMKNHDGLIAAESREGEGSLFTLYLPAAPGREVPGDREREIPAGAGTGRVLIMDDEELIGQITGRVLRRAGYETACARSGEEAVALYCEAQEAGRPFDLVILDLTIPGGMGGIETLERLRSMSPGVFAIVSSGYSEDQVVSSYREYGFQGALVKPYEKADLLDTVQGVLGTRGEGRTP